MVDKVEGWFKAEDESAQHRLEQLRAADALVLGRETYGFLSEFWPAAEGALTWNAQLLGANAAVAVAALKAEIPGQLISYGCGELANDLARHGLVDEIRFWLHPVVWGAAGSGRSTPASGRSGCDWSARGPSRPTWCCCPTSRSGATRCRSSLRTRLDGYCFTRFEPWISRCNPRGFP